MKSTGFNPQQLVNRGVFESLEEADAVLCDFDDARPGPTVIGVSWMHGFKFEVPISRVAALACREPSVMGGFTPAGRPECLPNDLPQGEIGRAANLAGYNKADADRPKDRVGSPNKPLMRKVNGSCDSRPFQGIACQNLPAACAVGAELPSTSPSGVATVGAVESAAGVVNTSRRSPDLLPAADSVLCPWCALERALSGQGSAARTGFVAVARCERHCAELPASHLTAPHPQTQPAA